MVGQYYWYWSEKKTDHQKTEKQRPNCDKMAGVTLPAELAAELLGRTLKKDDIVTVIAKLTDAAVGSGARGSRNGIRGGATSTSDPDGAAPLIQYIITEEPRTVNTTAMPSDTLFKLKAVVPALRAQGLQYAYASDFTFKLVTAEAIGPTQLLQSIGAHQQVNALYLGFFID
jgi:hypothetical protein